MSHLFKQVNPSATERTAFGEVAVAEATPVFQLDAVYGIDDNRLWEHTMTGTGYTDIDEPKQIFRVHTGTGPEGFCMLRSRRSVRYRPGQGSVCRFTVKYPTGPQLGYKQVAGFINRTDALAVGYNEDGNFGVVRRYRTLTELFQVQFTSASGVETITITLDDVPFSIPVTASASANETAAKVAAAIDWEANGWIVDCHDSKVLFLHKGPAGPLTGVFSYATTGIATATTETLQDGQETSEDWVYQADFNLDKLDGTGRSGMTLDTSKLNVFQIDFRWLGAGVIRFAIEDQATGNMILFHEIHYTNQHTRPTLSNPSMRGGYLVINSDPQLGTGVDVYIGGASLMGAIQGKIIQNTSIRGAKGETTANLSAGNSHHLLSLKNKQIHGGSSAGGLINQRELLLLGIGCGVSVTSGTRPAEISLYRNATFDNGAGTAVPLQFDSVDNMGAYSTTTARFVDGVLITSFVVSPATPVNIDLDSLRLLILPGDTISLVVRATDAQITNTLSSMFFTEE